MTGDWCLSDMTGYHYNLNSGGEKGRKNSFQKKLDKVFVMMHYTLTLIIIIIIALLLYPKI